MTNDQIPNPKFGHWDLVIGIFAGADVFLGKVVGSIWATRRYEGLEETRLLLVQPVNKRLEPIGRPLAAADVVDAGYSDTVFLVRAREASLALPVKGLPVDLAIVGVVDTVDVLDGMEFELPPGYTRFS